jgi:hypothetical protein
MTTTPSKITDAYLTWMTEDEKFRDGNKAAGTRARKALMEIIKLAKLRRKEVTDIKNT